MTHTPGQGQPYAWLTSVQLRDVDIVNSEHECSLGIALSHSVQALKGTSHLPPLIVAAMAKVGQICWSQTEQFGGFQNILTRVHCDQLLSK